MPAPRGSSDRGRLSAAADAGHVVLAQGRADHPERFGRDRPVGVEIVGSVEIRGPERFEQKADPERYRGELRATGTQKYLVFR